MTNTRRKFLKGGAVAATGTAIAGFPMIARAQQKYTWKMTSAYPKGSPFYMDGPGSATDLAKRIDTMSGGRLKIQVFGAGELIPAFEGFWAC
jgi:TRAP-type mannitol/chloroaromatic compound transport system substrate-binding protein